MRCKEMMNEKKDSFCRWLDCENETAIKKIDYPQWYDRSKKSDLLNIIYEGLSKNERLKTFEKIIGSPFLSSSLQQSMGRTRVSESR